jgi:hypothetical protein
MVGARGLEPEARQVPQVRRLDFRRMRVGVDWQKSSVATVFELDFEYPWVVPKMWTTDQSHFLVLVGGLGIGHGRTTVVAIEEQ